MLNQFSNFIFDLDNTLYDEQQYLIPVYKNIAIFLALTNPLHSEKEYYEYLTSTFYKEGREHLYDKLIKHFELSSVIMPQLTEIQRSIVLSSQMELFNEVRTLLTEISVHENTKVFVATNGNKRQQLNKIKQIRWGDIKIDKTHIYFAADYSPKPSPDVILAIVEDFNLSVLDTVYIGDSLTDEICAQNAGISFISKSMI